MIKSVQKSESEIQEMVVQYLEILERQWKVLWFTASGNWQWQKSIQVKLKMKREWVRAGMPDIFIVFNSEIVFIELKKEKGGVVSESQEKAILAINKSWWKAYIAKWFNEAKEIIDKFI